MEATTRRIICNMIKTFESSLALVAIQSSRKKVKVNKTFHVFVNLLNGSPSNLYITASHNLVSNESNHLSSVKS